MAKSAKIVGPFQIRSEKAKAQSLVELSLAVVYLPILKCLQQVSYISPFNMSYTNF